MTASGAPDQAKKTAMPGATRRSLPRITLGGVGFAAATAFTGFVGFTLLNNFVVLVFCLMVVALLFSAWYPFSSLFRLEIVRKPPPDLFAGSSSEFEVTARKRGALVPAYALSLRDLTEWFPGGRSAEASFVCCGGSPDRAGYSVRFQRRGLYSGGSYSVRTSFPFGFFQAECAGNSDSRFVVFPKLRYVSGGIPGSCLAGIDRPSPERFGGDAEFKRLREYVQGDNPRSIHWKSTARHGKLMVRDEERYEMKRATVLMDTRPPDIKGRVKRFVAFERAVSIAASVAAMLEEAGYVHRLVLTSSEDDAGPPARGTSHLRGIFTDLALVSPAESAPLAEVLGRLLRGPSEEIVAVASWPGAAAEARAAAAGLGTVSVVDASEAVAGKRLATPSGWARPCAWQAVSSGAGAGIRRER